MIHKETMYYLSLHIHDEIDLINIDDVSFNTYTC